MQVEAALHGASKPCNAQLLDSEAAAADTTNIRTNHLSTDAAHLDL
jgi:hypothetical protein